MKYILILSTLLLSSCSVIMAGSKETSMLEAEDAKKQISRAYFEKNISKNIVAEEKFDDIKIVTYSLSYDKAAKYRMIAHLGLDILTIGIWELIGTVGEANTNPSFYNVDVTYNKDDKITAVDVYEDNESTGEV